jgi:hypothetical protein
MCKGERTLAPGALASKSPRSGPNSPPRGERVQGGASVPEAAALTCVEVTLAVAGPGEQRSSHGTLGAQQHRRVTIGRQPSHGYGQGRQQRSVSAWHTRHSSRAIRIKSGIKAIAGVAIPKDGVPHPHGGVWQPGSRSRGGGDVHDMGPGWQCPRGRIRGVYRPGRHGEARGDRCRRSSRQEEL